MARDMTPFYNASIGGVQFFETYQDAHAAPGADDMEETAKLRIPGSDTTVIQKLGRATREFTVPGVINDSSLASLQAKRGQTVTLVRASGTSVSVFVDGIANVRRAGWGLGTATFELRLTL